MKKDTEKRKNRKRGKTRDNIEGALCVFSFPLYGGALRLSLCLGSRL
jgi:hypothetical protein